MLNRLKDRKLAQWALAYLAGAWLLLQVADVIGGHFGWPPAVMRALITLLGIGFLGALLVAWYHGERGSQRVSGPELLMLTTLFVIAATAVAFVSDDASRETAASPATKASDATAERGSIAVLPFVNMSDDRANEYFSDGVTEELIDALAQIPGLRVAARTSAFSFKGKNVPVDEIAQRLRVATVLEGSVRKAGNRLRITAQLVNATDGYHLWSKTYERELADVFAVQEQIAKAIAAALELELGTARPTLVAQAPENVDAYDLYLKGRFFWNKRTEEGFRRSIEYFEAAVARDPGYARAYAGLADANILMGIYSYVPAREAFPNAKQAAAKALALNPSLGQAHVALAMISMAFDRDWRAAERAFRRGIELDPRYSTGHTLYGYYLNITGRQEEAIAEARRGVELEPLSLIINAALGWKLHFARRYDEAAAQYHKTLELDPNFPVVHTWLGLTLVQQGKPDEAIAEFQRGVALAGGRLPQWWAQGGLGYAYAKSGRPAEARRILEQFEHESRRRYVSPDLMAIIYFGLDDRERAFQWLERAVEERSNWPLYLRVDPMFDTVRNDPRFQRLLKKMGLED
ncbi:MAG: tetratricopeptide repeat protein [Gemmatimonadota bacterium]